MRGNGATVNRQRKAVEQQSRDWAVVPAQRVSSEVTRIIVHSNEAIGTTAGNEAAQAINGKSLKTALNTGEKRTPAVSRRNAISNITNLNNSSDNTELAQLASVGGGAYAHKRRPRRDDNLSR